MPFYLQDWNWSDLFYFLIPLLYVLSQFLGSRDEKKKRGPGEETAPDEAELAERRRRIQEEIRRRIAGETAAPEQTAAEPMPRAEREAPRQTLTRPTAETLDPRAPVRPAPQPGRIPEPVTSAANDLEERLARQREALRQSRVARDKARQEAENVAKRAMGSIDAPPGRAAPAGTPRADVLAALRSRRNVRAAVVLAEVLGPPMGQRKEIGERLF